MVQRAQSSRFPSGLSSFLALALLGSGALLHDWWRLLGSDPTGEDRLAALDKEVHDLSQQLDDLRRQLRASSAGAHVESSHAPVQHGAAPVVPAMLPDRGTSERSSTIAEEHLSEANLVAVGKSLADKLTECCMEVDVKRRTDSIAWLEAMAVIAASSLMKIDVLIESGVASGFSAEVWGRFFAGTPVQIYAIDKNSEGQNDTDAAAKRLRPFSNVKFIFGDSMDEIPKILRRHRGQRIGIFVDGPKTYLGTHLALQCIEDTKDVKFAAQHDTCDYALIDDYLYNAHNAWPRVVMRTWKHTWREAFSRLDGCPVDVESKCGWGVILMAGQQDIPLSDADKQLRKVLDNPR